MNPNIPDIWVAVFGGLMCKCDDFYIGYKPAKGVLMPPVSCAVFLDKKHPKLKDAKKSRVEIYIFKDGGFNKL